MTLESLRRLKEDKDEYVRQAAEETIGMLHEKKPDGS
jgi:HEAT repeat protein